MKHNEVGPTSNLNECNLMKFSEYFVLTSLRDGSDEIALKQYLSFSSNF